MARKLTHHVPPTTRRFLNNSFFRNWLTSNGLTGRVLAQRSMIPLARLYDLLKGITEPDSYELQTLELKIGEDLDAFTDEYALVPKPPHPAREAEARRAVARLARDGRL
jgi:hypothetical protein